MQETALHIAIASNNTLIIREILDFKGKCGQSGKNAIWKEPDLTIADASGETALGFALWSGNFEVAKEIIAGGGSMHVLNTDGESSLQRALKLQDADTALFLIENGADVDERTPAGETPLQLAIQAHLPGVVRMLAKYRANMHARDQDGSPLLWLALHSAQEDIASILVENGCDTDSWSPGPGGCQQTLLHRAVDENNESDASFLIRSQCDINAVRKPGPNGEGDEEARDRQTPLHLAASWGQEAVVKTLVEHGANVNAQDIEGKTPVHHAVLGQHHEIVCTLLKANGLNLSLRDKRGVTPFAAAMAVKNNKAAQVILAKDSQSAYQTDNKGFNFLHTAVVKGDLESLLFLFSVQMDVNIPVNDSSRLSPLHLAVRDKTSDEMIVRNLLLAGANVNALTPRKQTALHFCAENDHNKICSILLEHGINYDMIDDSLNNALHVACQKGSIGTVRSLLTESKINALEVNMRGQLPLHVLAQYGRENAAAIFEVFMETMPEYPIDKPDEEGSTALILAYMNGNAQLCKAVTRCGACMRIVNLRGRSLFNYEVATKQLLYKLLDQLAKEPKWADGEVCSNCDAKAFSWVSEIRAPKLLVVLEGGQQIIEEFWHCGQCKFGWPGRRKVGQELASRAGSQCRENPKGKRGPRNQRGTRRSRFRQGIRSQNAKDLEQEAADLARFSEQLVDIYASELEKGNWSRRPGDLKKITEKTRMGSKVYRELEVVAPGKERPQATYAAVSIAKWALQTNVGRNVGYEPTLDTN